MTLQVLIAAYGADNLYRFDFSSHPVVRGVEYIVNWQNHRNLPIPQKLRQRADFKFIYDYTIGLCNARNNLLKHSSAEWVLLSDDDVTYTCENLLNVVNAIENYGNYSFLSFQYISGGVHKFYPSVSFDFNKIPKGYFTSSIEIALNRKLLLPLLREKDNLLFNTNFGVNGSVFTAGEEDLLIYELISRDYTGRYIPKIIASHPQRSTSERLGNSLAFIQTRGAVIYHIKPFTWPLRMLIHALRARCGSKDDQIGIMEYCRWWLQGVSKARKMKVFDV